MRHIRLQKAQEEKRKREEQNTSDCTQRAMKRDIEPNHPYLSSSIGMVSFTPEYIQYLKETYNERSYLGLPEYNCKFCNAMFWFLEKNQEDTRKKIKN